MSLRSERENLGISQSRLARLSGVSRFRICQHELGGKHLDPEELLQIETAIRQEAIRLRGLLSRIENSARATEISGG